MALSRTIKEKMNDFYLWELEIGENIAHKIGDALISLLVKNGQAEIIKKHALSEIRTDMDRCKEIILAQREKWLQPLWVRTEIVKFQLEKTKTSL